MTEATEVSPHWQDMRAQVLQPQAAMEALPHLKLKMGFTSPIRALSGSQDQFKTSCDRARAPARVT